MTRLCNFPISKNRRCRHLVTSGHPNCGRHRCEISAQQLGRSPTVYKKDNELHVWAGKPDSLYCLIHSDPAYRALHQLTKETLPCCLREGIEWRNEYGELHRDDGPAVIWADGTQFWYQHGRLHRDDGPAVIWVDGTQFWYQHDQLHREDGPTVIGLTGTQFWYQHGELHRDDGPAVIEADGTQFWYQHDRRHREDGPARTRANGPQEWYWHGEKVTEEEHVKLREQSRDV